MDVAALAADLRAAATRTDRRRLLVLSGERAAGLRAADRALDGAGIDPAEATLVSERDGAALGGDDPVETCSPRRADALLGRTRTAVVVDCHDYAAPTALGRVVGAVDGGGLLVLVAPSLAAWPDRRDDFDETLACPPFAVDDVCGRFQTRLVETLRTHPGVAVVDVDGERVVRDGAVDDPRPRRTDDRTPTAPPGTAFPDAVYEACLTRDQERAVRALERLRDPGSAVVVEADRGRGKSSAAGLAAGALAAAGRDVLVTAPRFESVREAFVRAESILADLSALSGGREGAIDAATPRTLTSVDGGRIRYAPPSAAADLPDDPDAAIVDEAAALPVRLLDALLEAPATAYCTTVHGYEGAGRSFDVRFRARLAERDHAVTDVELTAPIRYAPDDPVESWAFRALLLDASPAVEPAVSDATAKAVDYVALDPDDLLADEHRLREAFGLLVLAHYQTEPDDLARLLDAPNLTVRALLYEGRVVAVALLAREGGLDAATRAAAYEGRRIRGNMFPDVLTGQLRDETAAAPVGYRVVRIATHHAVRSRGLGSALLERVADELGGDDPLAKPGWASGEAAGESPPTGVDYLGVGYGATPRLLRFWAANGFRTVHLSTTRNAESGEYSALMGRALTADGEALVGRHARLFRERAAGVLADPLRDCDPDVVRGALAASVGPDGRPPPPEVDERGWRVLAGSAHGGISYVAAPEAARAVAVAGLVAGDAGLDDRAERLLVRKVLQGHGWDAVADELGFVSTRTAMQTLGEAFAPLVERWGGAAAARERERHRGEEGG